MSNYYRVWSDKDLNEFFEKLKEHFKVAIDKGNENKIRELGIEINSIFQVLNARKNPKSPKSSKIEIYRNPNVWRQESRY